MLAEFVPTAHVIRAIARSEPIEDAYVDRIVNVIVPRASVSLQ